MTPSRFFFIYRIDSWSETLIGDNFSRFLNIVRDFEKCISLFKLEWCECRETRASKLDWNLFCHYFLKIYKSIFQKTLISLGSHYWAAQQRDPKKWNLLSGRNHYRAVLVIGSNWPTDLYFSIVYISIGTRYWAGDLAQ